MADATLCQEAEAPVVLRFIARRRWSMLTTQTRLAFRLGRVAERHNFRVGMRFLTRSTVVRFPNEASAIIAKMALSDEYAVTASNIWP